jgi:hypothetical protein
MKEKTHSPGGLKVLALRIGKVLAHTPLPEFLLVATLIMDRFYLNIDFSYPKELMFPFAAFAIISAVVYYAYRLALRRVYPAHVAALLLVYLFYSYDYHYAQIEKWLKSVLPGNADTFFSLNLLYVVFIAVLCGLVGYFAVKVVESYKFLHHFQLQKVMVFGITFLFLTQSYKVGIVWFHIRNELSFKYTAQSPQKDASKQTSKPDVYYIVFDRYANATTLNDDYHYDNSGFLDFLRSRQFVVRDDAYANYPFTMSSISSTLAMQYHTGLEQQFSKDSFQTGFPYRTILNDPPAAKLFKDNGYTYNQVASWWDFTRIGIHADTNPTEGYRFRIFGAQFFLSDLERDIFNKSVMFPLLKKGMTVGGRVVIKYDRDYNPRENLDHQISALKNIAGTKNQSPQFTFAHILSPHDPYIFKADGSDTLYDHGRNDSGADETVKFTNQLTYLNTQAEDVLGYIRSHDPGAAIIVQADEGPYPKEFRYPLTPDRYYNPKDLAVPQMRQKFGVLASYYMPGAQASDVAAYVDSSVNPLRFVFSNYLGYKMDKLPDCNFATGDKFMVYGYELMTGKLTGKPASPDCEHL